MKGLGPALLLGRVPAACPADPLPRRDRPRLGARPSPPRARRYRLSPPRPPFPRLPLRGNPGRAGPGRATPLGARPCRRSRRAGSWEAALRQDGSPFGLHPMLSPAERSVRTPLCLRRALRGRAAPPALRAHTEGALGARRGVRAGSPREGRVRFVCATPLPWVFACCILLCRRADAKGCFAGCQVMRCSGAEEGGGVRWAGPGRAEPGRAEPHRAPSPAPAAGGEWPGSGPASPKFLFRKVRFGSQAVVQVNLKMPVRVMQI